MLYRKELYICTQEVATKLLTSKTEKMKTTKSTTLAKKIEKIVLTKELNKNSLVYGWVNQIVKGETEFRPVFGQGSSWKHSSLVDKTTEFEIVLRKLCLNFSTSNDAPRGGKTGVRIDIHTNVK